ncbi:hypothetical protein CPHO_03405 [Corynebacterium phocae]|uniref:HNH nuclease domain-containing protein n=1 Tax=Corynebacterium phocae TaxID=161895 RepID=A0A1L7D6A7_9CORY|nr:hypothetical protein CPHO_03405 [Corynebacterium phocae]
MSPEFVDGLKAVGTTYFGATTFTGKQAKARAALAGTPHDLASLLLIEQLVAKAPTEIKRWDMRIKLCATNQKFVARAGKAMVEGFKQERKAKKEPRTPGVKITHREEGDLDSLVITDTSRNIADMYGVIASASASASVDSQDPAAGARAVILDGAQGALPAINTNVVIQLPDFITIVHGNGADVTLKLTDGTTMTGQEYLERTLPDCGFVTLVHPVEGPVNLYQFERFASWKQRLMLGALFQRCLWPECTVPTDDCEYHHIEGWSGGGPTNVNNLIPLCQYHNRVNEDNGVRKRGRMEVVDRRVAWISPRGGPPKFVT